MPTGSLPRSVLVEQVRRRLPVDEREAVARRRVLDELSVLDEPWDRHAAATHLTGSGIVTGPMGVLLHLHRRLGLWIQPGGHLEPGEQPWDAALRESGEETGLHLRHLGPAPGDPAGWPPALCHLDVHRAGEHVHLDLRYRLVVVGPDRPRPPAGESQDVRWMPWDEAIAITDAGLSGYLAWLGMTAGRAGRAAATMTTGGPR